MGKVEVKAIEEVYKRVSSLLNVNVLELERESLKLYLKRRLRDLEVERFNIAKRYGISTSEEMEELYKRKKLSEKESWEDFFELDSIESEIDGIKDALEMF